jgi:signal transduction histidine kinase
MPKRLSTTLGHDTGQIPRRAGTMLRWLAAALVAAAIVVLAGAVLSEASVGLAFVSLGLAIAAATCWRIAHAIGVSLLESHAWGEVAQVHSILAQREHLWSALPAPAAMWDGDGQLLMTTVGWRSLGVPTDAPPDRPELSVGDPPRVFVVETSEPSPGGVRSVLLREVTRERQALQAKDELLAIVGHELRTPLSSIKGYGQLMARQLATVQEQVQRLDGLIDDVMDTARAEGGRLNLRREPLSISDLVRSACDRFCATHPARQLDKELGAHSLIEGDAGRLNQVMDNLLSNAAKYSPPDTPIRVRTATDSEWVRVSIADSGMGIAPQHLPRLFDRFYRVPGDDPATPPGFGLGLSIVRDLVEAHGGRVEVASEGLGTGCTFTVVLPVTLPLEGDSVQSPAVTPSEALRA